MSATSKPEKIANILPKVEGVDRRGISRDHSTVTLSMEIDHFIALANEARREYEDAAKDFARLVTEEGEMEATRSFVKYERVCFIMETQKVAATNAEKMATIDPMYLEHLEAQRDVVAKKNDAHCRMESARIRSLTAVAALYALGGWN